MTKTNEVEKDLPPIQYGEFLLVNADKLNRVIYGVIGRGGELVGGLGENAPVEEVLAHYDKIAGLITDKEGRKLANGCFWDFKKKKAKETPEIVYRGEVKKAGVEIKTEKVGDKPKKTRKAIEE